MSGRGSAPARLPGPVRTCVGCRESAPRSDLLRVVGRRDGDRWVLVVDPRRTLPGRGASLHPDLRCLDLAERRRAFARALRLPAGPPAPDSSAVRALVEEQEHHPTRPSQVAADVVTSRKRVGSNEHPMSTQR